MLKQFAHRPHVIGDLCLHRWCGLLQRPVNLAEVIVREEHCQGMLQHPPALREGVSLPGEAPAVLPQRPIEPFNVGGFRFVEVRLP